MTHTLPGFRAGQHKLRRKAKNMEEKKYEAPVAEELDITVFTGDGGTTDPIPGGEP